MADLLAMYETDGFPWKCSGCSRAYILAVSLAEHLENDHYENDRARMAATHLDQP